MKMLWDELRILVGIWIVVFDFAVSGLSAKTCKKSCQFRALDKCARSSKGIAGYQ